MWMPSFILLTLTVAVSEYFFVYKVDSHFIHLIIKLFMLQKIKKYVCICWF